MNINPALSLFVLVSISTAIYILNAIKFRVYLQRYEKQDFFESLKGLISVDFDHPSFPTNDEIEIRKRQKIPRQAVLCLCVLFCHLRDLQSGSFNFLIFGRHGLRSGSLNPEGYGDGLENIQVRTCEVSQKFSNRTTSTELSSAGFGCYRIMVGNAPEASLFDCA